MKVAKYLNAAGVPENLHAQATDCLREADKLSDGLTWAKWRARLFKAWKIARMLPWEAERLIDVRPDLADWDIAPAVNITAHGDNPPWVMTPDGGRPVPNGWLNQDPESDEYKQAVAANYWCKGEHPRSQKSRKAWYRRNAGEYIAWRLGKPMPNPILPASVNIWRGGGVTVRECSGAWQIVAPAKLLWIIPAKARIGYEIDNLWNGTEQAWYPISGHELRAPLTWSVLPGRGD